MWPWYDNENCGALHVKCIKKSTTEPDSCPNHCWEFDKCGYDALPDWCSTATDPLPKECEGFG